jgi:uncharacterized SAM-binding protein YcdF (DUF218 family)
MSDRRRVPRVLRRLVVTGVVFAAVAVPAAGAGSALVVERSLAQPDALVSLASHEWERLPTVARLAQAVPEAVVLLTRPAKPTAANCHLCEQRVSWLEGLGTPADRVLVLSRPVRNTRDEARAVADYRRNHPIETVMVVTSPYHARRALAVFVAELGSAVQVGVTPALDDSPAQPRRWWRAPYDRAYVAYEWTALVWYALRYGVSPLAGASADSGVAS